MRRLLLCLLILSLTGGCVYYNTFFLARQAYKEADRQRNQAGVEVVAGGGAGQKYADAIKKASKVLQNHPKSKYADDAILLIGKAFYHTGEFARAKEKFVELATLYRESNLIAESRFYLGMSEYELGNAEKSRLILEEIAAKKESSELRERAAFVLARIPYEEERYEDALAVLTGYLEKYPHSERAFRADSMIAASFWELERYDSARTAFALLADRTDDPELVYHALYRRSQAAYETGAYAEGKAEFRELARDDKFFEHKGILEYQIARGLRAQDSLLEALEIFRGLPAEYPKSEAAARALFILGEVYEERGESLAAAQDYFRTVGKTWSGDPEFAALAAQRSSEIGRLLTLQGSISGDDSTRSAETHFLLGELYLRQLDETDSALEQFRLVVDDYSESEHAPSALMNIADVHMTRAGDSTFARTIWKILVDRYPACEAAMWARGRIGLSLPEDISHSDILLMLAAEGTLLDDDDPDSALILYRLVAERFPESPLLAKALYSRAWILDEYFPGDDSTVYLAYKQVVDAYPQTDFGRAAKIKLNPRTRTVRAIAQQADTTRTDTSYTDTAAVKTTIEELADTTVQAPPPISRGTFDYPAIPGFIWRENVEVVFLIHINDRGEVEDDLRLVGGSGYKEIDDQARIAVLQTRFDPVALDPFLTVTRQWYKFSLLISPPGQSRDGLDPYGSPFESQGQN